MQVKIQNLSKTYKEKQVLQDISFDIKSGTVCGLLGVNGAGKSTTMNIDENFVWFNFCRYWKNFF